MANGVILLGADKPMVNFVIDQDLLDRIDTFRFERRFTTRAAAMKWLMDWALKQNPEPSKDSG